MRTHLLGGVYIIYARMADLNAGHSHVLAGLRGSIQKSGTVRQYAGRLASIYAHTPRNYTWLRVHSRLAKRLIAVVSSLSEGDLAHYDTGIISTGAYFSLYTYCA